MLRPHAEGLRPATLQTTYTQPSLIQASILAAHPDNFSSLQLPVQALPTAGAAARKSMLASSPSPPCNKAASDSLCDSSPSHLGSSSDCLQRQQIAHVEGLPSWLPTVTEGLPSLLPALALLAAQAITLCIFTLTTGRSLYAPSTHPTEHLLQASWLPAMTKDSLPLFVFSLAVPCDGRLLAAVSAPALSGGAAFCMLTLTPLLHTTPQSSLHTAHLHWDSRPGCPL